MKITFVFNNCDWTTIDSKVKNICNFFSEFIKLDYSIIKTNFLTIPSVTVDTIDGIGNTNGT